MQLEARHLREQKLNPYLTMLEEIMVTMSDRKELAGHIYQLIRMTETETLDESIRT